MKKMEERLIRCLPKEQASAVVAVTGRSVVKPTNTIANAKKRTAEEAFAGDKKTAEEHSKRQQTKYTRANPVVPNTAVLCEDQPIQTGQGDDGTKALPSMELQTHLAEVYFEYLYGQAYFLLHKPSYMRRLR